MRRTSAVVLLAMLGCAGQRPARHVRSGIPAELDYMRGFVEGMREQCRGEILIARGPTSYELIATAPPIHEVGWQLSGCGNRLSFNLDCSWFERAKTGYCVAHEWPDVVRPNGSTLFEAKLEATFAAADRIRCREKCVACADTSIVVHAAAQRGLTVDRCGRTFDAHFACTDEPYNAECVATLAQVQGPESVP